MLTAPALTPGMRVRYAPAYLTQLGPTATQRDHHITGTLRTLSATCRLTEATVAWADGFTTHLSPAYLEACDREGT